MSVANNEKVEPRQYRRRRVDSPSGPDAITEQPAPGRRRLGTPPDHPFTPREAWLLSRSLAGIGGDDDGGTPNMDVADLIHNLSILPLASRGGVYRAWLRSRPDAATINRLVADVDPVGPAPVDEAAAEDAADAGEAEAGDFDPDAPEAVKASRDSLDLSEYGTFEYGVASRAIEILAADSDRVYQKDGALVRLARRPKEGDGSVAEIKKYGEASLRDEITRVIDFRETVKVPTDENAPKDAPKTTKVSKACPRYLAKAILERGEYPGIRPLDRVVTAPVFRADGSIVSKPGYDEDAWVFHEPDATYPEIPEAPSRADAEAALAQIMDLVDEFPWVGERDKAVWLAGLLTLIGRDLIDGPAPLFALDGNQRGVGKGLATDVAAIIATGRRAPSGISMRGRDDDDELRKVIDSVAMANAAGMLLFDNLSGPIGGAVLDSAITSSRRAGRKLGGNETFDVESKITYWANGNNLSTTGDASRRALIARLCYSGERASEGRTFSIENLAGHVERHRPRLYAAAMTILRAHVVAGAPKSAKTLGSFEQWSWTIASAVAWITGIDPIGAVAYNVIDDPADEINAAILAGLFDLLGGPRGRSVGLTTKEILDKVRPVGVGTAPKHADLADALAEIGTGRGDLPTTRVLSRRLRDLVDRPIGGLTLRKAGEVAKTTRWTVEASDPLRRSAGADEAGEADTIPFSTARPSSPSSSSSNGSTAGEAAR